ncbi:MAG: hypothetical protein COB38_08920 [Gammaproteobacteria bacterium]|nr:MAG: hypothetical protein COB38_08920 [Gammaproteobacteria bacterium]
MAQNYSTINKTGINKNSTCNTSELADGFIYLNSGTEGSMPDCVINNFNQNLKRWASNPTTSYETDKTFGKHQHYQREKIAQLFSTEKDNICLTDNTTMGMYMALMGLNFKSSDTIIYTNQEHTAITSPLALHKEKIGIRLRMRKFPPANKLNKMKSEELIEFLFPNIKELRGATALCVSHVYPSTGIRLPLNLLRKKADQLGIKYLIVDGAQAFGMIDISKGDDDIKLCDFYACPGHKWLNGPPSTGILYLKNANIKPPEFYPTLSQRMEKYSTLDGENTHNFPMAEALQVRGCSNAPGFTAMLKAIEFQNELGGSLAIEEHILTLSQKVKEFIYDRSPLSLVSPINDPSLASGLTVFFPFNWKTPEVVFTDKGMADKVVQALLKKNIQIRSIGFNDISNPKRKVFALRISTAIFNDVSQLNQFQYILKDVLNTLT